jgi:adenylate kinase family enzyme
MKFTSGKKVRAQRLVIYGPESTGKTTLAAAMPEPVFLDTEDGSAHLDIVRAEVHSWSDMQNGINAVSRGDVAAKTLVIDTIDWAEKMLAEHICQKAKKSGLEDFGYGKGYTFLAEAFSKFLRELDNLIDTGISVCVLAHSTVKRFEAPDGAQPYDRYELKLSKQVSPLLKEWCDALLFLNWDTKIKQSETGKGKAVGGKERIIHAIHSAAWDAKNRHQLPESFAATIENLKPLFPVLEEFRTAPKGAVKLKDVLEETGQLKDHWFSAIEDALGFDEVPVNLYLVHLGAITSDQSFRDLDGQWRERALARPAALVVKAKEWAAAEAGK